MKLKEIPEDMQARAFRQILEAYRKDSDLSGFGRDVQNILRNLEDLYKD